MGGAIGFMVELTLHDELKDPRETYATSLSGQGPRLRLRDGWLGNIKTETAVTKVGFVNDAYGQAFRLLNHGQAA
jgi:hypothetical protein